jgi:hypothetical protein
MVVAVRTSETPVFSVTTRLYISEGCNLIIISVSVGGAAVFVCPVLEVVHVKVQK